MKPENAQDQTRGWLRDWKVQSPLPPRFQEDVWRRIALAEALGITPMLWFRNWLAQRVMRPSFACTYAAILLGAGLLGGFWQARETAQRASETLGARYVQMVDPYLMPRR